MGGFKPKKIRVKLTDEKLQELLKVKEVVFLQHEAVTITLTKENYEEICFNLGDKVRTITWEVW